MKPDASVDLREIASGCFCFKTRRLSRTVTRFYEQFLGDSPLTPTQFTLLAAIQLGKDAKLSDLAKYVGMDRTTFTRTLAVLERRGWVESQSGVDARTHHFTITKKGIREFTEAIPAWRNAQDALSKLLEDEGLFVHLDSLSSAIEKNFQKERL